MFDADTLRCRDAMPLMPPLLPLDDAAAAATSRRHYLIRCTRFAMLLRFSMSRQYRRCYAAAFRHAMFIRLFAMLLRANSVCHVAFDAGMLAREYARQRVGASARTCHEPARCACR